MLNQFVKSAGVLRWLTLEKREGHTRTALGGTRCCVSQGNTPQAVQTYLCISASRKLRTAQNTDFIVSYATPLLS